MPTSRIVLASLTFAALTLAWPTLHGCGGSTGPATAVPTAAPSTVRYTFEVDRALERMSATVCFEGPRPPALAAIHEDGRQRIVRAGAISGNRAIALPHAPRIDLTELEQGACVRYVVDLTPRFGRSAGGPGATRVGDDLIAPSSMWLWAPQPRDAATEIRARFVLPEGMRASTVWPEAEDGWLRLDDRAFRYLAYVAFGTFEVQRVPVPGGCLEAALLDGALDADAEARAAWLGAAGRAASQVLGRFPAERAGILIVPVPYADTPVLFGIVGRGVLPTVTLLMGEHASPETLVPDWTAVHEFTHIASPYVERDEAWLTEGLATYYQQTLRAREGLITPEAAWNEMLAGFTRGRADGTGRSLERETREMRRTHSFGRIYWAGAAIAMLADIEYRRASGGAESLDHAMRRAASRIGETMTAAELVRAMDGRDQGIFAGVVARWLGSTEFPDVDTALAWLGVVRGESGIELAPDAAGAAVRDAIMNQRAPVTSDSPPCEQ